MTLLHHPRFSSWARGHLLCRVDDVGDRFALTFDDGPSGGATPRLLDLLATRRARATFFLLGGKVARHPGIARRIAEDGHEPALHGYGHWPLALLTPGAIRRDLARGARTIERATGVTPRYYRPPFGFMMPGQSAFVRALGYQPVLGDVYPEDPHRPGVERIVRRTLDRLRPGSILILHDGGPLGNPDRSQTLAAVAVILERAAALGLAPVTVGELLAPDEPAPPRPR